MRRPFFWPAVSLAMGTLLGRYLSLPRVPLFVFVLFLLPFLWFFRGRRFFLPLFFMALMGVGTLRIRESLTLPSHHIFYFAQKGEWVSLEGRVDSLPTLKEKGRRRIYSFVLKSENVFRQRKYFETRGGVQVFLFNPPDEAPYGSRIRMRGRLALPRAPQNPGEFDYRKYLADQGIHAVFEGHGSRSIQILSNPRSLVISPLTAIQRLRGVGSRRLDFLFPTPVNSLLKALIFGIRKDLPEGFRDDSIKTGTAHLVAISGMNITLVAGSLFFISLCLGLPQKAAALVGLLSTVSYVFLSGAEIPVVRAGWMASLFFTGILLEREKDLVNSLFFAFFAILVFDPLALFQVGFQLSFLSVLSLIVSTSQGEIPWKGEWFQTIVVLIGTFPLCIAYFNVFFWGSVFANVLAIPLFHMGNLGGLGTLLGAEVPLIGPLLRETTSMALKAGIAWIHFLAEKPWGYIYLSPPSWKLILFYYGALALVLVAPRFLSNRMSLARPLSFSLWLVAAVLFFLPPQNPHFALTILSAGQNELLHVEFPRGGHWLVNAGRDTPSNQARWILAPLLRKAGVNRLNGVLLTDLSRRHSGGLDAVLENFSVASLLFPEASHLPQDLRRVAKKPLRSGDQVAVQEEGGFQILSVAEEQVFLLIHYRGQRFLLLPTWKREVLQRAMPELKKLSSVDVLILPGSGRPDETVWKEILSLVLPRWVVVSKRKPVLDPLLQSLHEEEIPFLCLSDTGALRFEIQKGQLIISSFLKPTPLAIDTL